MMPFYLSLKLLRRHFAENKIPIYDKLYWPPPPINLILFLSFYQFLPGYIFPNLYIWWCPKQANRVLNLYLHSDHHFSMPPVSWIDIVEYLRVDRIWALY